MSGIIGGAGSKSGVIGEGTNSPAWLVRPSSNQSIPNATHTKVSFQVAEVDTHGAWDNSNMRWTVPGGKGGMYHVAGGLRFPYLDDQERIHANWRIDGTAQARGSHFQWYAGPDNDDNLRFTFTAEFELNSTQYIELWVWHDEGAARNFDGGSSAVNTYTFMSGYRINI